VLVPDTAVAGPAVLLEAGSGRVLYAEDQDHGWYPASLTKIMTAYIAFEEVKAGRLKLTDMLSVSETAHAQSPSKLGLPVGGEITLDLGLRALIVKSANDVAVMIAERISGSVEAFAERMNATAKRLGMTRTRFTNPNGLPAPDQVTTARDLARLAYAAIRDFPEQDAMWALQEVRIGKQRLRTHNRLLGGYEGADGIKTGFICDSGFNVVASATRDGRRLVAVVLGEPSGKDRNLRAATLLEHGFATSEWKRLFGSQTLETLPVDAAAKAVASVRTSVVAWNCGGRKPAVARKGVKRRAAEGGAASGTAAKATATKVGAAGAKNKALAAGAGAAQPKAPAPAKKPAPAATPRAAVAKE
jgi:D-alanyl-D-alanine carboxypeptidase